MAKIDPVFEISQDLSGLEICERLYSFQAINPLVVNNSSSRCVMSGSHMSQLAILTDGDEPIIQSGLEKQFSDNTWSVKIENDSRVVAIIERYDGITADTVSEVTEVVIIVDDLVTGMLDYYSVPYKFTLHQNYGFKYIWNNDVLMSLTIGSILRAGTILADSPTVRKNNGYAFGLNANMAMVTIPEVAEDGFVISESFAKRLKHNVYETITIEYGTNYVPLNIYGDSDNYKPYPDIGEYIRPDGVVVALRKNSSDLSIALMSKNDMRKFDPTFDKPYYAKYGGGKVVDIIAHDNVKFKKNIYTNLNQQTDRYVKGLKNYYEKLISAYEKIQKEHYKRYHNWDVPTSEKLSRLMVEAYAINNVNSDKIKKTYKKQELDLFRVTLVIEHTIYGKEGVKLSDLSGGKGVITKVLPDSEMIKDPLTGKPVDVIGDPTSTVSRMNLARLYNQYLAGASRKVKHDLIGMLGGHDIPVTELVDSASDKAIKEAYTYLVNYLKIYENEQYFGYVKVTDLRSMREILHEAVTEEVYVYFRVGNKKKSYQIVSELRDTVYSPILTPIDIPTSQGMKKTKEPILIAPLYMIVLNKSAENFLSTASSFVNHYGVPVSLSKSMRSNVPWKNSGTKVFGETEIRLISGYGGRKAIAELKDRAANQDTHKELYKNLLTADVPTNIDVIIDRDKFSYGGDSALKLVESIFNASGIDIAYTVEKQ